MTGEIITLDFNQEAVHIERDDTGTLRISSEQIAEGTGSQHASVLRLIDDNSADFEAFGRVRFEIRPFETAGGTQTRRIALLNEQQATLLVSFSRNTEPVKTFKVALVKAFYEMAQQLATPAKASLAERTLSIIGELNTVVEQQAAQLEAQKPMVAQASTYASATVRQTRQEFARDVIAWAQDELHVRVLQRDVLTFLSRKLGLFVGGNRADTGHATIQARLDGLADTDRGVAQNGHAFATGVLTAKGVEYAWSRVVRYLNEHNTLALPDRTLEPA